MSTLSEYMPFLLIVSFLILIFIRKDKDFENDKKYQEKSDEANTLFGNKTEEMTPIPKLAVDIKVKNQIKADVKPESVCRLEKTTPFIEIKNINELNEPILHIEDTDNLKKAIIYSEILKNIKL